MKPTTIEKLRVRRNAAADFLRQMKEASDPTYSTDLADIKRYLFACLVACKNVKSIAERNNHSSTFTAWRNTLPDPDCAYLHFLEKRRNANEHGGDDRLNIEEKWIPYRQPRGGVQPPHFITPTMMGFERSSIKVMRHRLYYIIGGQKVYIEDACKKYLDFVDSFIEYFVTKNP